MSRIRLAFYKGKGNWLDTLIRWYTRSKYSHVEMVIDGMWYSASLYESRVRRKVIASDDNKWDFVDVECEYEQKYAMKAFLDRQLGKSYDYMGVVLSQVLPLEVEDPKKWFCSELCARALQNIEKIGRGKTASWYSPGRLYDVINNGDRA